MGEAEACDQNYPAEIVRDCDCWPWLARTESLVFQRMEPLMSFIFYCSSLLIMMIACQGEYPAQLVDGTSPRKLKMRQACGKGWALNVRQMGQVYYKIMATQRSKFLQWIDFRVRITIQDGRMMVGTFLAFDKHMNVVLADTEEYRITKTNKTGQQKQIKRTLGLVIVRGQNIISLTAEAPPSQTFKKTEEVKPGKATSINRPGTMPSQPPVSMPSLVGPNAPLPSTLKAPNMNVNLPKPPSMPPM